MLFNSLHFLFFFPVVAAVYFAAPHRVRWVWLLAASFYFYMCWRADYIVLIAGSTLIGWACARWMDSPSAGNRPWTRHAALFLGVTTNLAVLFVFKYYNFARDLLTEAGGGAWSRWMPDLHVLLPVGISFYTFQILSYCVDVHRRTLAAERHLGRFALYVSFFPQLVAGPIERASNLLPQFTKKIAFSYENAVEGAKLMAWGFFKKCVVADRLAPYVETVYSRPQGFEGGAYLMATYFFAFQIYADFSAYSDIARGAARILGFNLMLNFDSPYAAQSIREFWQRWHISLSTWFRDYVYIPLGGNRVGRGRNLFNLLLVFTVSGLWHGANLTFLVWGAFHGVLLIAGLWLGRRRFAVRSPGLLGGLRALVIFHVVLLGWVFFRAASLRDAMQILQSIARTLDPLNPQVTLVNYGFADLLAGLTAAAAMLCVDYAQSRWGIMERMRLLPFAARWGLYTALVLAIYYGGVFSSSAFIYFQF